nr:VASA [Penaeus merguiensis]
MSDDWGEPDAAPACDWNIESYGLPTSFGTSKKAFDSGSGFGEGEGGFGEDSQNFDDPFGSEGGGFGGRGRSRGGGRGGGRGGSRACFKCGDEGHMARDCPSASDSRGNRTNNRRQDNWGGGSSSKHANGESFGFGSAFGQNQESDPFGAAESSSFGFGSGSGSRGGRRNDGGKGCFKCGEEGHMSRDCPSGGGRNKGCFKCSQEGHNARDCPNPGEGDEKKPRAPIYIPEDVNEDDLFVMGIEAGSNFDAYANIQVNVTGDDPIQAPAASFQTMNLRPLLLENIVKAGYGCPTPVQKYTIPNVMNGRDIMGCAQTGSGKTAAFLLPMLHYILDNNCPSNAFEEPAQPTGLVICPTRELAIQIMREARKFSHSSVAKCCVAYGGAAGFHQLKTIHSGCHILVATPGRLLDFVEKGKIVFSSLKYLVLDEADRMLDMGFLSSIKTVINHKTMTPTADRITLMFSATFPNEIQELASAFLNNYLFVVVGSVGAANTDVKQEVLSVPKFEKKAKLIEMCEEILINADDEKILVFVEQKRVADFVGTYLCEKNFRATTMHGDRYQAQREQALTDFRTGVFNILVATAVAARGLDIKGIGVVVNYDLPKEIDEYVHRIGRTGRLGNRGLSISFYDEEADACLTKDLVKVLSEANQTIPDWLTQKANTSGYSQTYYGSGLFASSDIRTKNGGGRDWEKNQGSTFLGGPSENNVDEEWD